MPVTPAAKKCYYAYLLSLLSRKAATISGPTASKKANKPQINIQVSFMVAAPRENQRTKA
jgi:hypothetical protein